MVEAMIESILEVVSYESSWEEAFPSLVHRSVGRFAFLSSCFVLCALEFQDVPNGSPYLSHSRRKCVLSSSFQLQLRHVSCSYLSALLVIWGGALPLSSQLFPLFLRKKPLFIARLRDLLWWWFGELLKKWPMVVRSLHWVAPC